MDCLPEEGSGLCSDVPSTGGLGGAPVKLAEMHQNEPAHDIRNFSQVEKQNKIV